MQTGESRGSSRQVGSTDLGPDGITGPFDVPYARSHLRAPARAALSKVGAVAVAALILLVGGGCSRAAEEHISASAEVRREGPAVQPLAYDAPDAWSRSPAPPNGPRKAVYRVPRAGADAEDADLIVLFFGTGALGGVSKNFDTWLAEFDGDAAALAEKAERETFTTKAGDRVSVVKLTGSYKRALAPPVGPKKVAPVTQLKEGFRLVAAAIETQDRGNWFFRLLGPEVTVRAAEPALRTMLESAR